MKPIRTLALAAALCALIACGQDSTPTPSAATPPAAPPASDTAAANDTASTSGPAPAAAGDTIGITACDDYLEKYQACLNDKVPAASRELMANALQQTRDGWKQVLASPGGAAALETACLQAHAAARTALQAYGCEL